MTQQGRGVLLLSASATRTVEWVRRGVVPCHVLEHPTWSIVVPASATSEADPPYDDALTVLASRHVPSAMAPSIGLLEIDDIAIITARAPGRAPIRWALRDADRQMVRGPQLPPLSPEQLHRALAAGSESRPVPISEVRGLWGRTDLTHLEWLVEATSVLGLPGGRVLDGSDSAYGPVIPPDARSVQSFESVVKDVHP